MTDDVAGLVEAKPCPFCGGTDIRFDCHLGAGRGPLHYGETVWSVCCYNCGATFPNRYNRELLVECWNRRVEDQTIATLQAQLEDARGERAAVVKWLRGPGVPDHSDEGGCPFDKAARMIEHGQHREDG